MGKWKNRVVGTATGIKCDKLDELIESFDRVVEEMPSAKRRVYRKVGEALLVNVQKEINQRLNDSHGKVARWQDYQLGSKGGYVKVLPTDDTKDKWGYSGIMKTYALEKGHLAPTPSGRWKRYEPRLEKTVFSESTGRPIVRGRLFYSWAKMKSSDIALEIARTELRKLLKELEV